MAIALSFVATAADKICNIYSMKILNGNFMLGGRRKKVEIDELMFGNKRKYNCGHVSEGQWVFGMVVRDTGQSLLFRVPDHQRETLVTRVLHEFNEPGTVIISDKLSPTTCRDSAVKWKGSWRRWMGPWEPKGIFPSPISWCVETMATYVWLSYYISGITLRKKKLWLFIVLNNNKS